jgi:transposase
MIGSSPAVRVFAYRGPTDLRKGFDGLAGLVGQHFKRDLQDGELLLFINRRKTSATLLHWNGTGVCIYATRLARGRFTQLWETGKAAATVSLTRRKLSLLMEGANLRKKLLLSPKKARY